MKKLLLFAILILASCTTNQEEETNCNCTRNLYEREYFNSSSYTDRFINKTEYDGCFDYDDAMTKQWTTSNTFTIIQCDEYL
jgi:hypothetical protein